VVFLAPVLSAQHSKYLKVGVNYASFRTEGGKSQPGLSFGFGKKYYPLQNFGGHWGFELGYAREKILLEDKTWPTSFFPPYSGVEKGGFNISLGYLDLSLHIGYLLNVKKMVGLEFYIGPSLSIPIDNNTKVTGSETIYLDPKEISDDDFDFKRYDADPGPALLPFIERGMNFNTNMIVGTALHWKYIHLSLSYSGRLAKPKVLLV
jgi:hypothetical protein